MSCSLHCHLPLVQGVRRRATLRRVQCQAAGAGDDQAPPAFNGWAGLPTNRPERGSGAPRREAAPRRGAGGREDSGPAGEEEDGEWSPRREQAAARRSLTWDERGTYVAEGGAGDSPRGGPESRPARPRRPPPQNSGAGGAARQFANTERPPPRRTGPPPPRGGPAPVAASGAARRVAERERRDSRAPGGAPGLSREQRKAPFRLGATAAAKPRGPREDSVEQLRARETALAALPLPLPVASNAHPFRALGLSAEAGEGLQLSGVSRPTPIQQLAIPALVQGTSTAVLAETGSGKTLAYCLPLATRLYAYAQLGKAHAMRRVPATACPEALIIVPNRELGVQVAASARAAAEWCQPDNDGPGPGTRQLCVVTLLGKDKMSSSKSGGGDGRASKPSAASLAGAWGGGDDGIMGDMANDGAAFEAADIVIATPRTVLQLQKAGRLRLGRCRTVVLDEADELLSAGFVDDVAAVVRSAAGEAGVGVFGQNVQLVCVAATLSRQVWDEVVKPMIPVKMGRIATEGLHRPAAGVIQRVVLVKGPEERAAALLEALKDVDAEGVDEEGQPAVAPGLPALIFTNSTVEADAVAAMLQDAGLPVAAYHGKVQGHRGELLDDLQEGQLAALVVTDMAARGLDLPCVRNVVQWRPAPTPTLHLHRLGRTGRASAQGPCQASVLVDRDDEVDTAAGATATVLYASTHGWDAVGELIDTRRRE